MSWFQMIFLVLSVTKEILKLVNEHSEDKREAIDKFKQIKQGAMESRKDGNTKKIEEAFRSIGLRGPDRMLDN